MANSKRYKAITKFIPALEDVVPADWSFEPADEIADAKEPICEYWDVIYRLMDAALAAEEAEGGDADPDLQKLCRIFREEENCPGLLYGMLVNGTVLELVKALERK